MIVAFTVQSLYADSAGLKSVTNLQGPFESTRDLTVASRFADTAVETIALPDVEALVAELIRWMGQ